MTGPRTQGDGQQAKGQLPETVEQRKLQFLAAAEAVFDRLLAWEKAVDKPNMTMIEDEVLALRHQLGMALTESVLEEQAPRSGIERAEEAAHCSTCGELLVNKGRRKKHTATRLGDVEIKRPYAYCPDCGRGLFPP